MDISSNGLKVTNSIFFQIDGSDSLEERVRSLIDPEMPVSVETIFLIFMITFCLLLSQAPVSDLGCQSRGCVFETQLGQHSFRRLTKITVTSVIHLPPWASSMWLGS